MIDFAMNDHNIEWAYTLAKAAYESYKDAAEKRGEVKVREGKLISYVVGKLGEVASHRWLEEGGFLPYPWFAENDKYPDIITSMPNWVVEIKSWQWYQWCDNLAYSVPTKQFASMLPRCNLIFWCSVDFKRCNPNKEYALYEVMDLFKTDPRTVQLVSYSWSKDLRQPGTWMDVKVRNKKGEMLYSKQLGELGVSYVHPMEKFIDDVREKHLLNP